MQGICHAFTSRLESIVLDISPHGLGTLDQTTGKVAWWEVAPLIKRRMSFPKAAWVSVCVSPSSHPREFRHDVDTRTRRTLRNSRK